MTLLIIKIAHKLFPKAALSIPNEIIAIIGLVEISTYLGLFAWLLASDLPGKVFRYILEH